MPSHSTCRTGSGHGLSPRLSGRSAQRQGLAIQSDVDSHRPFPFVFDDQIDLHFRAGFRFCDERLDANDVRMGMRVVAHWVPPEERKPSMDSIQYFKPIDEPDVAVEDVLEALLNA